MNEHGLLNAEQSEKLANFQTVTGIEDMCGSILILKKYNWDLNRAVGSVLERQQNSSRTATVQRQPPLLLPTQMPTMQSIDGAFTSAFSLGQRLLENFVPTAPPTPKKRSNVTAFVESFEGKFGKLHPDFSKAKSYSQAVEQSRSQLKFLAIYIYSDTPQNDTFCRNTLCTDLVSTFLDEHFVVWVGRLDEDEGYRIGMEIFKETSPMGFMTGAFPSPLLAIVHFNAVGDRHTLSVIKNGLGAEDLITQLINVLEKYADILDDAQIKQKDQDLNRLLREEQDKEFQQALLMDQEEQMKQRAMQEQAQQAQQAAQAQQEERVFNQINEQIANYYDELKAKKLSTLPPEPSSSEPHLTLLVIRLPDGSRIQRRFKESDTLQLVMDYLDTQIVGQPIENFELVTQFPMKVYSDFTQTLKQLDLCPKALLLLQHK